MNTESKDLAIITKEITKQIADPETQKALIQTTFKGFEPEIMKQAILEGVIRGYTLRDFLERDVYAIKYGSGYNLVTSIDSARKKGMRSGIVGVKKPEYTYKEDGKIEACTVTVQRKIDANTIGDFTAEVFFDEYYRAGKTLDGKYTPSLWDTKPRTMISKVAEMHALRKACPEELAQAYIEEEFQKETKPEPAPFDPAPHLAALDQASTLAELKKIWTDLPAEAKQNKEIVERKDEIKEKLTPEPEAPRQTEAVDPNA